MESPTLIIILDELDDEQQEDSIVPTVEPPSDQTSSDSDGPPSDPTPGSHPNSLVPINEPQRERAPGEQHDQEEWKDTEIRHRFRLPNPGDLCWRCGLPGHLRDFCQAPPVRFCSRCGKVGVLSRACPCGPLMPPAVRPPTRRYTTRGATYDPPSRSRCPLCGCRHCRQ